MRTDLLYGPVQEDIALVEATFDSIKQVDYAPLAKMMDIVLAGGGKLLRPALTLLGGRFGLFRRLLGGSFDFVRSRVRRFDRGNVAAICSGGGFSFRLGLRCRSASRGLLGSLTMT